MRLANRVWRCVLLSGACAVLAVLVAPAAMAKPAAGKANGPAGAGAAAQHPLLDETLSGPLKGCERLLFASRTKGKDPHWYANFGYWSEDPSRKLYGERGQLCMLDLRTGKAAVLIDDPAGAVRDPAVHYDGRAVLFSWRRGKSEHYNLYEMDLETFRGPIGPQAANVPGLRRITDGPWDDIEPCWLPDDDIVFCSSRCNRWVNCWYTQVAILYRAGRDGSGARPISTNIEHDNTPCVLPDGRLLYTRWEYVDRSQVDFHHLWTSNPDGTGVMAYFGNMHKGMLMIDAAPIPGSDAVACIFSPGHGANEHCGSLTILRQDEGPDERKAAVSVPAAGGAVRDPCPIDSRWVFAARGNTLLLFDTQRNRSEVVYTHTGGGELMEPRLLRPRARERVIPDRVDGSQATGRMVLADVYRGRNMAGVRRGDIRKLLVLESLPKPINFSGGPGPLTWLGTFTLERVVGTVPVEPDGSAYFELPANRPFFFVAMDANDLSVKRMQSFAGVMPGETTGCVGCHDNRTEAPRSRPELLALRRPVSQVEPVAGVPSVIDFLRDVQPVLDRHCVRCHDFDRHGADGPRAGGVVLAGDRGPNWPASWHNLIAAGQVADGRNDLGNSAPRTVGTSASPLMRKIGPRGRASTHHGVKLDDREWRTLWAWIESGATSGGTYAALGSGTVPGGWMTPQGADALQRRCYTCHTRPASADGKHKPEPGKVLLPAANPPAPAGGAAHARFVGRQDDLLRRGGAILYNLTRPEKSPILLASLAKQAGGWADGPDAPATTPARPADLKKMPVVFRSTEDPDYKAILAAVCKGKETLDRVKRPDMPGFVPNDAYIREMKRYGILPPALDVSSSRINVYEVDEAYWRSFWHAPKGEKAAGSRQ